MNVNNLEIMWFLQKESYNLRKFYDTKFFVFFFKGSKYSWIRIILSICLKFQQASHKVTCKTLVGILSNRNCRS